VDLIAPIPAQKQSQATAYPALFRNFIANNLRFVLADVQESETLSAEQRREGLQALDYGLADPQSQPDACALLLALAPHLVRAGLRDEWQRYLERGLAVAPNPVTAAELVYHLGDLAQFQGHFAQAESHFADSAAGLAAAGRMQKHARSLNRLAYVLRLQQRQPEAERLARQAISLLGKADPEWAYSRFVLGTVAFDQRDDEAAVEHLSAALAAWEQSSDDERRADERRADGLVNLAPALRRLHRYDEAIACLQEAGDFFARRQDPRRQALVHLNLSNIALSQAQWEDALAFCRSAEPLFHQVGDALHQAINYNNMGVACRRLGRLEQAERTFSLAIAGFEAMDQPMHHINALDGLGNTYRDQGRYAEAARAYHKALTRVAASPDPAALQHLAAEVREHLAGLPDGV